MRNANAISKFMITLVLAAGVFAFATQCGKAADDSASRNMVVVFVNGDARIIHETGKEEAAKIGLLVREKDQIKTTNGSVDLQTRTGSAVRIREFTTITVASLAGKNGGESKIKMDHGGLLANVKKASSNENFSVVTPTAVAGVRGTKFSVDVQDGQQPRVKVVDGKVAMAPRVAALDNYTSEEIESSETLSQLKNLEKQEIVLEENTEGTLDPKVEEKVLRVSEAIEASREESKAADAADESTTDDVAAKEESRKKSLEAIEKLESVQTLVAEVKQAPASQAAPVQKKEAEFTAQEKVESQTLVIVDPSLLEKVAESQEKGNGTADVAIVQQIQQDRAQKEEKILDVVKKEAEKNELSTDEEIKAHYNKLEKIILKNGTTISGAVIAQTGNVLMIHSKNGVQRVNKSEIEAQEFLY
jgi:hypothetical protein